MDSANAPRLHRDASRAAARPSRWPGTGTTPSSVTDPADYAVINGVYLLALAGVAALWRDRRRKGADTLSPVELPVMAAATFALAEVLANEKVTTWLREPFAEEGPDHKPVRAEGEGLRYAIGELLTCSRCVGAWSALTLIGLRTAAPDAGRGVSSVLATVAGNHFLQARFRLLREQTNRLTAEGQTEQPA